MTQPSFKPMGEAAVLVSFADEISDAVHRQVLALDQAIAADPPPGLREVTPALVNLLVVFDVTVSDHASVQSHIMRLLDDLPVQGKDGQTVTVQVCYESPFGADLDTVARATAMTTEAVIAAHLAGDYQVLMYGFAPGYAYMAGVPGPIQVPRKPAPVRGVAAGSVIIAGPQCLVTTLKMPTGWSIIGRSPTPILPDRPDAPFLFGVGDRVRFERIDMATFDRLAGAQADA